MEETMKAATVKTAENSRPSRHEIFQNLANAINAVLDYESENDPPGFSPVGNILVETVEKIGDLPDFADDVPPDHMNRVLQRVSGHLERMRARDARAGNEGRLRSQGVHLCPFIQLRKVNSND